VNDVLEADARRRFLESLSMYERQGARPGPEVNADLVSGTGIVVSVEPERKLFDRRATVGTATEISHHLAMLLAWSGQRDCLTCARPMQPISSTSFGLIWRCDICRVTVEVDARHYSPWHYAAACSTCNGVGTLQIPNPEKLIVNPDRPLCSGAMYSPGFFPKGYLCKPLNGGYDMVQALATRYDFDPFVTPWAAMSSDAKKAFLFGDPVPMDVHFQSRNQSYVRRQPFPGFFGFIRDWDVGGTYTNTEACPACKGAKLRPEYLATTLAGYNFHDLNMMDLISLARALDQDDVSGVSELPDKPITRPHELIATGRRIIRQRLRFLAQVGLGYLNLDRLTATLSAGEAQRVRLAGLLGGELSGLTLLLDEPTRGLHPSEVQALLAALHRLRDQGNCVIVVEHDLDVIQAADQVVEIGPGAGVSGGTIVFQGRPKDIAGSDSATGRWLRQDRRLSRSPMRPQPSEWLAIHGARANNLNVDVVALPRRRLVGVCGVSGSGKSTLIVDTLGRALAPKKHTTSVASEPMEPGRYESIDGAPARTIVVDQARAGVASPVAYLRIDQPLRRAYAESERAVELGLTPADFRRNCPACKGRGLNKIDLGFLPALRTQCELCAGTGYGTSLRQVRLGGFTLPEISKLTIAETLSVIQTAEQLDMPSIRRPLQVASEVGLDYLVLRQPGHALSGGEAQRLKIARELCHRASGETLYILDEPSLGQHMEELQDLVNVLDKLVEAGNSVIIVEHQAHILASCDWLVEIGPGGGANGGQIIFSGEPAALAVGNTPMAPYLAAVMPLSRSPE
jgi:excinuclease ABC subunit A